MVLKANFLSLLYNYITKFAFVNTFLLYFAITGVMVKISFAFDQSLSFYFIGVLRMKNCTNASTNQTVASSPTDTICLDWNGEGREISLRGDGMDILKLTKGGGITYYGYDLDKPIQFTSRKQIYAIEFSGGLVYVFAKGRKKPYYSIYNHFQGKKILQISNILRTNGILVVDTLKSREVDGTYIINGITGCLEYDGGKTIRLITQTEYEVDNETSYFPLLETIDLDSTEVKIYGGELIAFGENGEPHMVFRLFDRGLVKRLVNTLIEKGFNVRRV